MTSDTLFEEDNTDSTRYIVPTDIIFDFMHLSDVEA
jgi:hypothetical protein